jgi:hypothetical protein
MQTVANYSQLILEKKQTLRHKPSIQTNKSASHPEGTFAEIFD